MSRRLAHNVFIVVLHSQHKLSSMHDKSSQDDMYALMYELVTSFDVWLLYFIINNVALASNKQQSKWMSFFSLTITFGPCGLDRQFCVRKTFSSQNTLEKGEIEWVEHGKAVRERVLGGIRSIAKTTNTAKKICTTQKFPSFSHLCTFVCV